MVEAVSGALIAGGVTSIANFLSGESNRAQRTLERNIRLQGELRARLESGQARIPPGVFIGGLAQFVGPGGRPIPTTPTPLPGPITPTPTPTPDVPTIPDRPPEPSRPTGKGPALPRGRFDFLRRCIESKEFRSQNPLLCAALLRSAGRGPEAPTAPELRALFRPPIPRPRTPVQIPRLPRTREDLFTILRRIQRLGRIIFPGGPEVLTEIPELFPVRLPTERRRTTQPQREPVGPPAPAPAEPLPEIVTVPQTAPPPSPRISTPPQLGRITFAAGAALASAVGIRLAQRQTTRIGQRIGEPLAPPTPAPPVPPLPIPPALAPAGLQSQLRTRQRECQEVKRRRRRKGKCREGFFEELPGRTRFITWREVDCVTRRENPLSPLRGI